MPEDTERLSSTTSLCPSCLEPVSGTYETRDETVYLTRWCPDHGTTRRRVWASRDHWTWARQFGPDRTSTGEGRSSETVDPPRTDGPGAAQSGIDLTLDAASCGGEDRSSGDGVTATSCCGGDDLSGIETPLDGVCCSWDGGGSTPTKDDDAPTMTNGRAGPCNLTVDGNHACLAVVEITQDCNLSCSFCYASSGPGGTQRPFDEVVDLLETVKACGGDRPIQFSGGEPTVHDRLPELVERSRAMGFGHVEVNTNGIALANREGYAQRLADAGMTAVYLQFDGLERETYREIRNADLLATKHEALAACRRVDLPVILVPTVVPGTNDDEMGDVVRYALDNRDIVRAVNFQPVAHFGRYATHDGRFSLDAAASRVADQVDALAPRDFLPVPCCSSYCQLSTAVVPDGQGDVMALTGLLDLDDYDTLSGMIEEADWLELLAGTPLGRETFERASSCYGIEVPAREKVLPVTLTGFMDADAADVDRLENCCISVPTPDGDLVPFCAYNMTTDDGRYALRNRHGWGGREMVGPATASTEDLVDPVQTDGGGGQVRAGSGNPSSVGGFEQFLGSPWQVLGTALDGPLHPGGTAATTALLDRAGVDDTTRLLDIGCGAGEALRLARQRNARAVGLDRSPPDGGVRGDLGALPFGAETFDVVLGECVICLSGDLALTLDEIARVLPSGGRLALSDVTVEGPIPTLPSPVDEMLCLDPAYSRDHLRDAVTTAGFDIEDERSHRDDLLEMRDRLLDAVDYDGLVATLGDRGTEIDDGVAALELAIESGRIGYVSIVATRQR